MTGLSAAETAGVGEASGGGSGAAALAPPSAPRLRALAALLPLAALLAYLAVLGAQLPTFLERSVPQSDTVSPLLLTEALFSAGHGTIHLGAHAGFSNLLLVGVTLPFPDHRVVSQVMPYAVYLLGALLLSGTSVRLGGWRAGILSLVICVAVTPALLFNQVSPAGRVTTLANLPLLGLFAIRLAEPAEPPGRSRRSALPAAVAIGVLTGFDIASDPYLLVVGVLPFAITALALWRRWRDAATVRLARHAAILVGVAAAATLITFAAGLLLQLHYGRPAVRPASLAVLGHNLRLLGAATWNAIGTPVSYRSLGAGQDVLGLVVCALALAALGGSAVTLARGRPAQSRDRARAAHSLFWSLVAAATVAAFVATNYPVNVLSIRYLTPLWLALAALLPLLGRRGAWGRRGVWVPALVALLVTGLSAASAWSLATLSAPAPIASSPLVQALEANHLTRGYADYWESNAITWATDGRVAIRAVVECGGDTRLCPDRLNSAEGWYRPTRGPTAVIVNPALSITRPPTAYGAWSRVIAVGAARIYVFEHGLDLSAGA